MRSYKEVADDKNYEPSADEIKAMQDALNLVGFIYNCKPHWAPVAENLYAEAFYAKRAMPAVWESDGEEYYIYVWFTLLNSKRELEVKIGANILEIETEQILKYDHDFCFEKSNEVNRPAQNFRKEVKDLNEDSEPDDFDSFYKSMENIEKNGYDLDELRAEAARKVEVETSKRNGWLSELNRLVRLSKRNDYIKRWENEYGSIPENTPYDDALY